MDKFLVTIWDIFQAESACPGTLETFSFFRKLRALTEIKSLYFPRFDSKIFWLDSYRVLTKPGVFNRPRMSPPGVVTHLAAGIGNGIHSRGYILCTVQECFTHDYHQLYFTHVYTCVKYSTTYMCTLYSTVQHTSAHVHVRVCEGHTYKVLNRDASDGYPALKKNQIQDYIFKKYYK